MNQRRTVRLPTERILPSNVTVYKYSPFPALRHTGKEIVAMIYVVTLACARVCRVHCIVAVLIDFDVINLVQVRKSRFRRNSTLQL
jgi:hypothetical protein